MIDYEKEFEKPAYAARQTSAVSRVFATVYGWMGAGLAISGGLAWYAFTSGLMERLIRGPGMMICIVAELVVVLTLSAAIRKLPAMLAFGLFIGYAALNGLTLSIIFAVYELGSIANIFFITAAMFGGLALYGTVTKSDLSGIGSFCGMALWGVIIASIVNIFVGSAGLDWVISFVAILVFTGLTMYDAQKIRQIAAESGHLDAATVQKVGLMGALALYLDFVNLFLHLLQMFGRRR